MSWGQRSGIPPAYASFAQTPHQTEVSEVRQHPTVLRKLRQGVSWVRESHRAPLVGDPLPPVRVPADQLGITFIGHSSFLLQVAGRHLLIDPVFARSLILLRRQRRAGVRVEDLPAVDAVLLTHAHMDHLNLPSLRRIIRHTRRLTGRAPACVVPHGLRDLVEPLGFHPITELTWWNSTLLDGEVEITLTPAKHWGARLFRDTHRLFGGYVIAGGGHRVYHSGDTAYFSTFAEIGQRLRPDVALLPIGAYFPDSYRAVHTSPEEALRAFLDLRTATTMIPMHFGTFPLGREPIGEPPVRLMEAARRAGVASRVRILHEGETLALHAAERTGAEALSH